MYYTLFTIIFLIIFLILLSLLLTPPVCVIEENFDSQQSFIPSDKIIINQGNALPIQNNQIMFDYDPSAPSVDGLESSPHSLFAFTYNKCSPSCCDTSPYSCSGGCVCIPDQQMRYISGKNKK